jgi:hypothetical protein
LIGDRDEAHLASENAHLVDVRFFSTNECSGWKAVIHETPKAAIDIEPDKLGAHGLARGAKPFHEDGSDPIRGSPKRRPLRIAQCLDLRILLWPTALWPSRYPGAEPQLGELLDLAATGYLFIYSERAGKVP